MKTTSRTQYTEEEKKARFNFIPFVSCITHRIEWKYKSGAHVSAPAKFITDAEAIQAAKDYLKYLVESGDKIENIVVLKYDKKGCCTDNVIFEQKPLEFVNVMEDSYPLYEYCVENDITDMNYEDWYQAGGELSFFEGDPDIIKVHGNTGYFCRCGNTVFYYFDDMMTHDAEYLLKAFYNAFETGVTLGGYSWIKGDIPEGVSNAACIQNWDAFDKINTGIAWRGGAGYIYNIFACGQLLARA